MSDREDPTDTEENTPGLKKKQREQRNSALNVQK